MEKQDLQESAGRSSVWNRSGALARLVVFSFAVGVGSPTVSAAEDSAYSLRDIEDRLIRGAAEFIVRRAQQEAAYYFQSELADKVCAETADRVLLPGTCELLKSLGRSSLPMTAVGGELRTTLRRDLRELPGRKIAALLAKFQEAKDNQIPEPTKLIAAGKALAVIGVGTALYRSSRDWGSLDDARRSVPEKPGEVCHLSRETKDGTTVKATDPINTIAEQCTETAAKLLDAMRSCLDMKSPCQNINSGLDAVWSIRKKGADEDDVKALRNLLSWERQARRNVLRQVTSAAAKSLSEDSELIRRYSPLFEAVLSENPADIVAETVVAVSGMVRDFPNEDVKDFLRESDGATLAYVATLGEIAQADNPKEVADVIERVAAPVGTYREKLRRPMYSVTSFLGYSESHEKLAGSDRSNHKLRAPIATIGIHGTYPIDVPRMKDLPGHRFAIGAYFSLFDLGPLVAERDSDTDGGKQSQVGIEQVFAPGIYVTANLNVMRLPLVVGYGISRTPSLVTTNDGKQLASTRQGFFIAMDLTLFGF